MTQIAFVNAAAPPQHAALFNGVYWQVHYIGRTIGALCGPLLWEATDTAHAVLFVNATAAVDDDAGGWAAGASSLLFFVCSL